MCSIVVSEQAKSNELFLIKSVIFDIENRFSKEDIISKVQAYKRDVSVDRVQDCINEFLVSGLLYEEGFKFVKRQYSSLR